MSATDIIPRTALDVERLRSHFPALHQEVYDGQPLVYLDNAATSQKPQAVLDRLARYYSRENSNIHRGVHRLSQDATDAYEEARTSIARHINAPNARQCIFTRGTTEAVNLVAASYGRANVRAGDEVVISALEHHSNIVPWQLLCQEKGASLRVIPMNDDGELLLDEFEALLNERTRLVAVSHISNALGTINDVDRIIASAHRRDIPVLIDGAQALPHMQVDVQALDCDFYCFSGHKMFGPTGTGILYGRESLLEEMPPYHGGGDMIDAVTFEKTTYAGLPHKFEAGTPHIAGGIGLGAAVEYLRDVGLEPIGRHETDLLAYATEKVLGLGNTWLVGTAERKAGVLSFLIDGIHPYDAGTVLDRMGVAVRTGHHCAQPIMDHFGIPGTIRASFAFYNNRNDVDRLAEGLHKVKQMFG